MNPLALTLYPEMAWAITALSKRVENRPFAPMGIVGKCIAIHAGKYVGGRKGTFSAAEGIGVLCKLADRAGWEIFADNRKVTVLYTGKGEPPIEIRVDEIPTSAIVAVARVSSIDSGSQAPWSIPGMRHWHLADVLVLKTPIPCSGKQGLWPVSDEVARAIREQVGNLDFATARGKA